MRALRRAWGAMVVAMVMSITSSALAGPPGRTPPPRTVRTEQRWGNQHGAGRTIVEKINGNGRVVADRTVLHAKDGTMRITNRLTGISTVATKQPDGHVLLESFRGRRALPERTRTIDVHHEWGRNIVTLAEDN